MAIGTTNISIGSIITELGLNAGERGLSELFGYVDISDGISSECVNYHNNEFGPSNTGVPYNLYDPHIAGTNQGLNNWRSYNHLANMKLTWIIENTTREEFTFDIMIERPGYGQQIIASNMIGPEDIWAEEDYDSGLPSDPGVGYKIVVYYFGDADTTPNVFDVQDFDNVGPGTTRQVGAIPPFVPRSTPFYEIIVEGEGSQEIPWSKRTQFQMTI